MRDFKKLLIWKNGMEIIAEVENAFKDFPDEEQYGLKFGTMRNAISIAANVAEGCISNRAKTYKNHLEIALCATLELRSQILIAQRKWLDDEVIQNLLELITEEQRMLSSFIDKLKT